MTGGPACGVGANLSVAHEICSNWLHLPGTEQGSREHHVLQAFCRRSAPILAFWRSRFGVLPPGVLPWRSGGAWRSGSGVLVPWRSGSGVLGCLAFWVWRSGLPGVLLGVLPWRSGGWRSAGVLAFCLAFCRRSGVLQAFWRSAWRSSVLPCILLSLRRLSRHAAYVCDFEATKHYGYHLKVT